MAESLISSPEAPLLGELSAKQTERLYEGKPARKQHKAPGTMRNVPGAFAIRSKRSFAANSAAVDG